MSEGVVAVRGDKQYFEVIGGLDQDGCVMRAVCELAGAHTHTLTDDEKSIMAAFRWDPGGGSERVDVCE